MKNRSSLIAILSLSVLAAVGCGEYSKNPVDDISSLREYGTAEQQRGPDTPRVQNNEIVVVKEVKVPVPESSLDGNFISIIPDAKMTFNEGTKSQFQVRARVAAPGIKIKLVASGLPQGATLEKSPNEEDLYLLTWTPAIYSIPADEVMKVYDVKISAEVTATETKEQAELLKGMVRYKEVSLFLFRNQQSPTELTVTGLDAEIKEGTITPITVTAKVPGIDGNSPQKPTLYVTYDGISHTAGNEFLELDGARYVVANGSAEYVGDSVWKFKMNFDTKNISVQPQLAKDGTVMTNATGTRVRMIFKVFSPFGMSTPATLSQVKISFNKPAVATTETTTETAAPETVATGGQ